jgi:glycosyltransferase involved in cell wall biosynthesis
MFQNLVKVSAVMPLYNEEQYIANCVDSLLRQDYPQGNMEWIFVDGKSTDKTVAILKAYQEKFPHLIYILSNPNKTVPYAMNIGIANAKGNYIIRLDAHADYATDYIKKCVHYLDTTGADNVGGVTETRAKTSYGKLIAKVLSSKFGVGNSQFRTGGKSGYVDTVPFGAFRRDVFERWGGYDERLTRNQDNEMNYRIRKNGGKIWLAEDIHLTYYCRDTLGSICNMAYQNGRWNVISMKLCPGSMGIRHFIPLLFVLSIIGLLLFGSIHSVFYLLLLAEIVVYILLDCYFSAKASSKTIEVLTMMTIFPSFHISYGMGSMKGIFELLIREFPS